MRRSKVALVAAVAVLVLSACHPFDPWKYDSKLEMAEAWFECCYHRPQFTPAPAAAPAPAPAPWSPHRTYNGVPVRRRCDRTVRVMIDPDSYTPERAAVVEEATAKIAPHVPFVYAGVEDYQYLPTLRVTWRDLGRDGDGAYAAVYADSQDPAHYDDFPEVVWNTRLDPYVRGMMHELAHAAGLGHVGDFMQIMASTPSRSGPHEWAAGDLAGLRELGC